LSCLFTGAFFIASIAIAITRRTPRKGVNHLGDVSDRSPDLEYPDIIQPYEITTG
jgi:hypothetical protein